MAELKNLTERPAKNGDTVGVLNNSDTGPERAVMGASVYSTVAELRALAGMAAGDSVYLNAAGRTDTFTVRAGDYSAQVTADTDGDVYIAMADDATGAAKCLVAAIGELTGGMSAVDAGAAVADAVQSTDVTEIVVLTEGEYEALPSKDPEVMYVTYPGLGVV